MVSDAQIRSVTLFFFFAFLEESLATSAIDRCLLKMNQTGAQRIVFSNAEAETVYWTNQIWKKLKKKAKYINIGLNRICVLPKDLELEAWRQLQKEILPEEYLSLIWSGLLQFTDSQIGEGLALSGGTIQHRNGIAMKRLGQLIRSGKANAKKRA